MPRATLDRGWPARYLTAVLGAAVVYVAETLQSDPFARSIIADFAWTAAALGAVFGTARARRSARDVDRLIWSFFCAGAGSWLLGQLARDAIEIAGVPLPRIASEVGFIGAAPLWTLGLVLVLRRHRQRLALYALVLDIGAIVLTLVASIALVLATSLPADLGGDPQSAALGIFQAFLYIAATAAALCAFWSLPADEPRGSALSLLFGLALNAAAAVLCLPAIVGGRPIAGTPLDAVLIVAVAAIGIAGQQWLEDRARPAANGFSSAGIQVSRMIVPGIAAAAGSFMLVYADVRDVTPRVADVVDGAIALTVLIVATRAGIALYENWNLGKRERRRAEQLAVLYEVGLATAGVLSLDDLTALIAREATALTGTDGAMVAMRRDGGGFVVRAQHNAPALGLRSSTGEALRGVALEALLTRELVVASHYRLHPDSNPLLHDLIGAAIAAPLIAQGEIVGTLTAYARRPRAFSDEICRLVRLYAAQAAIAIANADLLAETRRLARDDDLTGVLNRRSLLERLESLLADATRHGETFAVALCDVDGLKGVNDTAGHLVGNEVLRAVARVMRETVRTEDIVSRFGGDEFVILFPRTGPLPAQASVSRIVARLREEHYMWAGAANRLPRASFGLAWFPQDGRDADALLNCADARMYEDKARARATPLTVASEAD